MGMIVKAIVRMTRVTSDADKPSLWTQSHSRGEREEGRGGDYRWEGLVLAHAITSYESKEKSDIHA